MTVDVRSVDLPNGETLGYRVRDGGDVPVLLLHGNMVTSAQWDVFFEGMDPKYSLVAPDMRGFGDSTYETPIDSLWDLAGDVRLFVDELGLESFHVVGWSLGGAVAMALAADHPERVGRLVLLAPVGTRGLQFAMKDDGGEPTEELITSREGVAADPVRSAVATAQETGDTDAIRKMWDGYIFKEPPAPERYEAFLEAATTQRNQLDVTWAMSRFNLSEVHNGVAEGTGRAADVEAPTLVVRGTDDRANSHESASATVADVGPNAELVEFEGCGHAMFVDEEARTLETVQSFLG